ncbi:MAG: hypothetical protein WD873_01085, partial [Candidatus Hydrogenedentales bacterium]
YVSGGAIRFDGIQMSLVNNPGAPAAGDTFTIAATAPGVYLGDGQIQEVEIQAGTLVAQNIPGNRVFQGTGIVGGVDVFAILNEINRALATNDRASMTTQVAALDTARAQVANERASVGSRT